MNRLKVTQAVVKKLSSYHLAAFKQVEKLSFAFGHQYTTANGDTIVVVADTSAVLLLSDDCFSSNGFGHVAVSPDIRASVYMEAVERGFNVVLDIHDHHFASAANFSSVDNRDDLQTAVWFNKHLPQFLPEGCSLNALALLIAQNDFAARQVVFNTHGQAFFKPYIVDIIGDSFLRYGLHSPVNDDMFSRHKGMLSPTKQETLKSINVVVVGAGGTGSITCEGLSRVGVRTVTCIDSDIVEKSNLNRMQGVALTDVGEYKCIVLKRLSERNFPNSHFTAITTDAFSEEAINALKSADFIISCVDNNETRWFLHRLAVQFLIPFFDIGVLIEVEPKLVFHHRLNAIIPALTACGHCSPFEFFTRKQPDAFLSKETLSAQRLAGYVKNTTSESPATSSYFNNQMVVSWLLKELVSYVGSWHSVAISIYQRSDAVDGFILKTERIDFDEKNHVTVPAEDCPICSFLIGKCNSFPLPQHQGEDDVAAQIIAIGD